jgi:transposase
MAMGKWQTERQQEMWIAAPDVPTPAAEPFYRKLNQVLAERGFDAFVEGLCQEFYHESLGRDSIPPGVYFRMLLLGYFEGIDSERGIAWRCGDSLSFRAFLNIPLNEATPDHSSLSKIRGRIDLGTHEEVFTWVLKLLAQRRLVKGKTLGVDATTLEANAALRSIVRRDTGESYNDFLTKLAAASGIATPTREDLAKIDKKRKNKASNDDWVNPNDPDAKIAKMKDGRTHLAHKAEHAVDLDTGAIVGVTLQGADRGDTTTLYDTVTEAAVQLNTVAADEQAGSAIAQPVVQNVVADKGYHSNETTRDLRDNEIRTYISEPDRGRRVWVDEDTGEAKSAEQAAVYANRRRIRGDRGKALLRKRGELLERPFAHCYETGGMRRTHLRGHPNILKRLLIHVAGFNLGLVMRQLIGIGKPRRVQDGMGAALLAFSDLLFGLVGVLETIWHHWSRIRSVPTVPAPKLSARAAA